MKPISIAGMVLIASSAFAQTNRPLVSLANVAANQQYRVAKDFAEVCPSVEITTGKATEASYVITVVHETFMSGWISNETYILVQNADQVIVFQDQRGTVKIAVKKACAAILSDWQSKN
jgi:hypothetical protein